MSGEIAEYLKVVAILIAVAAFAFVALRVWLPRLTGVQHPVDGPLYVACRLPLEPRKTLYIVRAGTDYVLLSSSDAGVEFLTSLDPARIESQLHEASHKAQESFGFSQLLRGRRQAERGRRAE